MKVSIITVVFNGIATLQSCIESVLMQDYEFIEYIIIDGNSTDGTKELIKSYGSRIHQFISEPDKGIYDAMNKGIAAATGDVIGVLNADDFYAYHSVISDVVNALKVSGANGSYGDLDYVDAANDLKVKRKWISGEFKTSSFLNGWMPPHPTFFLQKTIYDKHGSFRLDMGSAADYELMLRMIEKIGIKLVYIPKVLVKMRDGGVSNSSFKNRLAANRNDKRAWEVNHLKPRFYTLLLKPLRKVSQFL
ncbi:glycosyltransferase family 2 protein [Dyadobacter sp. NIV53]|uniref:glycosyltransferase family 2 protein n=1 Tax=Dyadobacter sp. NIV53 TaxID=2861765 RepID=UPI001C88DD58|nr:glycosyltransferase family 2 protein [Dyadobacter sp. NIV53]